jgi:hypothetical protein
MSNTPAWDAAVARREALIAWRRDRIASAGMAFDWVVAFFSLFFTDLCWSAYVGAVRDSLPLAASLWAVALFVFGAVAVLGYTKNKVLLIPSAAGAFAGTWLGVWLASLT